MRKVLLVFAAAGLLIATPSCKKGENDPFLSLKSRKSRLAGEYTVESSSSNVSSVDSNGDKTSTKIDIDGNSGRETISNTPFGEATTTLTKNIVVNKAEFTISKDGTWSHEMNTTTTWTLSGDEIFIDRTEFTTVSTLKESGNWSFLGGQPDEFKNKERVLFSVIDSESSNQTTSVTVFTGDPTDTNTGSTYTEKVSNGEGQQSIIYEIDRLKNKEIVLVKDNGSVDSDIETEGDVPTTYSITYTGDAKITLAAK